MKERKKALKESRAVTTQVLVAVGGSVCVDVSGDQYQLGTRY